MFVQLKQALDRADIKPTVQGEYKHSAVCLIVSDYHAEPSLLMIKRAKHWRDPWSGHMAFPGGRIDPTDNTILRGALRELKEEVGVKPEDVEYVGQLSTLTAKHIPGQRKLLITPYIFYTNKKIDVRANYEVAKHFWIPLSFFKAAKRRRMCWFKNRRLFYMPYYRFQRQRIWGLSLAMIEELFSLLGAAISSGRFMRYYHQQ